MGLINVKNIMLLVFSLYVFQSFFLKKEKTVEVKITKTKKIKRELASASELEKNDELLTRILASDLPEKEKNRLIDQVKFVEFTVDGSKFIDSSKSYSQLNKTQYNSYELQGVLSLVKENEYFLNDGNRVNWSDEDEQMIADFEKETSVLD